MQRVSSHPVQLMMAIKKDEWCKDWPSRSPTVAFNCAMELIGEERMAGPGGSEVIKRLTSLVYLNYDRLRRNIIYGNKHANGLLDLINKLHEGEYHL